MSLAVGVIRQMGAELRVLVRARRNRTDLVKWLIRRPALLAVIGGHEMALMGSARAPLRLKLLAQLRTSSLIGCPF